MAARWLLAAALLGLLHAGELLSTPPPAARAAAPPRAGRAPAGCQFRTVSADAWAAAPQGWDAWDAWPAPTLVTGLGASTSPAWRRVSALVAGLAAGKHDGEAVNCGPAASTSLNDGDGTSALPLRDFVGRMTTEDAVFDVPAVETAASLFGNFSDRVGLRCEQVRFWPGRAS